MSAITKTNTIPFSEKSFIAKANQVKKHIEHTSDNIKKQSWVFQKNLPFIPACFTAERTFEEFAKLVTPIKQLEEELKNANLPKVSTACQKALSEAKECLVDQKQNYLEKATKRINELASNVGKYSQAVFDTTRMIKDEKGGDITKLCDFYKNFTIKSEVLLYPASNPIASALSEIDSIQKYAEQTASEIKQPATIVALFKAPFLSNIEFDLQQARLAFNTQDKKLEPALNEQLKIITDSLNIQEHIKFFKETLDLFISGSWSKEIDDFMAKPVLNSIVLEKYSEMRKKLDIAAKEMRQRTTPFVQIAQMIQKNHALGIQLPKELNLTESSLNTLLTKKEIEFWNFGDALTAYEPFKKAWAKGDFTEMRRHQFQGIERMLQIPGVLKEMQNAMDKILARIEKQMNAHKSDPKKPCFEHNDFQYLNDLKSLLDMHPRLKTTMSDRILQEFKLIKVMRNDEEAEKLRSPSTPSPVTTTRQTKIEPVIAPLKTIPTLPETNPVSEKIKPPVAKTATSRMTEETKKPRNWLDRLLNLPLFGKLLGKVLIRFSFFN